MEYSRQEYWIRLSFPTPGDLPDPRIEPESLASSALEGGFTVPICLDLGKTLQPGDDHYDLKRLNGACQASQGGGHSRQREQ